MQYCQNKYVILRKRLSTRTDFIYFISNMMMTMRTMRILVIQFRNKFDEKPQKKHILFQTVFHQLSKIFYTCVMSSTPLNTHNIHYIVCKLSFRPWWCLFCYWIFHTLWGSISLVYSTYILYSSLLPPSGHVSIFFFDFFGTQKKNITHSKATSSCFSFHTRKWDEVI